MGRPREFDEASVLDAAIQCFWSRGYEATSVRDLVGATGITAASLYNAYGDKRALFRTALDRYVEQGLGARIRSLEAMRGRVAIAAFFAETVARALHDGDRKGCMVVNTALELAPHDPELAEAVAGVLGRIEGFFRGAVERGQSDGSVASRLPAEDLARHLLGVLMGVRVLARVRPDEALLGSVIGPAMALLDAGS